MTGPRVLTLDIETSPNVAHVWQLYGDQHISLSQLRESSQMIGFAAKWLGESEVMWFSDHHDGHEEMVHAAHGLLDDADILITYNGVSFDEKYLRREFFEAGLEPPSPYKSVDLCRVMKNRFRFPSNKLDYITQKIGLGAKVKHDGHPLWVACLAGDDKAWAKMRTYCIGDVRLTEKLYRRVLPWIVNHPNQALYTGKDCCPRCGSTKLQSRGKAYTPQGIFQQRRCNRCGSWSRGTKRMDGVDTVGTQ